MKKNKATRQWGLLIVLTVVWIIVLVVLYPTLPEIIPIQFSLSGTVNNTAYKSMVFVGFVLIYTAYMIYTWIRFKKKEIPGKNLFTLYFVMMFSVFVLILGTYLN